jgi:hypothetical protein
MKDYSYKGSEKIMVGNEKYWVQIESGKFTNAMWRIRLNENKEYTGSYGSPGSDPVPKNISLTFKSRMEAPTFSDKLTEFVINITGIKPDNKENCLTIDKIEMTGNDNTHLFYTPNEIDGYCGTTLEKKF